LNKEKRRRGREEDDEKTLSMTYIPCWQRFKGSIYIEKNYNILAHLSPYFNNPLALPS
jgi:hypothetical protein